MTSKRGSGTTTTAPLSHYNDLGVRERWPVLIYRLQSHRGWEIYSDPDKEAAASTSSSVSGKKTNAAANKLTKGSSGTTNNSNSSSGNDGLIPKTTHRAVEELTVVPREGCIEVRKMRLRIKLFEQHTPWDPSQQQQRGGSSRSRQGGENQVAQGKDSKPTLGGESTDKNAGNGEKNDNSSDGYDSDTPGSDGWNDNSLLVRRRNSLLVTTRRGCGAIMFQFKSIQECLEFCDRLVYLNWNYLFPPRDDVVDEDTGPAKKRTRSTEENDGYTVNGMDKRELYIHEMIGNKRQRCAVFGDVEIPERKLLLPASQIKENNGHGTILEEAPAKSQDIKQCNRKEEMMSYIVRLAHSEDFRGFVDELERGLETAPDTAAIHAALGF